MPERYTLIDNETGERFNLGGCNMADIISAFREIAKFNNREFPYRDASSETKIWTWEEFENTYEILKGVQLPNIDY